MDEKNAITRLSVICGQNELIPNYDLLPTRGVPHAPTFECRVQVSGYTQTATGHSKKKAKHAAAKAMIEVLIKESDLQIENAEIILESLDNFDTEVVDIYEICEEEDDTDGNPVGKLQEICAKQRMAPPYYDVISADGPPHDRLYTLKCMLDCMSFEEIGAAKSKRLAKRKAALLMIKTLKNAYLTDCDDVMDKLRDKKSNFVAELIDNWNKTRSEGTVIPANEKITNFYAQIDCETCDLIEDTAAKLSLEDDFMPDINSDDYFTLNQLANALNATVKCLTVPSLSYDSKFQCLIHIIPTDILYTALPIATSWGSGECVDNAKQDAARRAIKILSILKVKKKSVINARQYD